MSNKLSSEFKNVIKILEENIKDQEELELVKVQIFNLLKSYYHQLTKKE